MTWSNPAIEAHLYFSTSRSQKELWVSLSTYGGVNTRQALEVFWAAGIRHVELAIGVKPSADTVEVLRYHRQQGMQYRAHHAVVWQEHRSFNLAQTFDRDYFERLTDWMATMNVTAYSVHPGSVRADVLEFDDRALQHLGQVAQLCHERSIRLGVETMYPTPLDRDRRELLQNTPEIEQFLEAMPQIELVVDLAHLNLWHGSTLEKLQLLQLAPERLLEIHISDDDLVITNIFFVEKDSSGLIFQDDDSLVVHSQQRELIENNYLPEVLS
ncbi:MAG: sugar phosphate isomerase/epimerase [Phormidesmis sp. CAN_BIN36]|nr:sugar phosphate isomerase/epimerase [Phormidesmis sp. CAN_BIN36]